MRIHRSAQRRAYTVISNAALQDNRLSFVARGVLGYLLSRFDGERMDVRKLAGLCRTGRQQVANALDELKARGYYEVVRVQDADTGRFTTRTYVYENPEDRGRTPEITEISEKTQVTPAAGDPVTGVSGHPPTGVSRGRKPPPTRPASLRARAAASQRASAKAAPPLRELAEEDATLLARIAAEDGRLRIGRGEAGPLVPLLARWRERGVSDSVIAEVLTTGLPERVLAPAGLVRSRLERKLPPDRVAGSHAGDDAVAERDSRAQRVSHLGSEPAPQGLPGQRRSPGSAGSPGPLSMARWQECRDCGRPLTEAVVRAGSGRCDRRCIGQPPARPAPDVAADAARRGGLRVRAALTGGGVPVG